jgi:outer membrane cobalamin receptor
MVFAPFRFSSRRFLWGSMPLLVLRAAVLWAGESSPEEEENSEVVVITADRIDEEQSGVPASISVIHRDEIQSRSPSDATELLQGVPGVDVQSMSPAGYGANVSIRGSSDFKPGGFGNRVLVLLDGWPMNTPDTGGVDWAALPLLDIDRIEVLRGPASVLYGSSALGGVVQLISRQHGKPSEISLGQGFSGIDGNKSGLFASLSKKADVGGFRLSGWVQQYTGFKEPGRDEFQFNSDSSVYGVRITGNVVLSERQQIEGALSTIGTRGGNPGFEGTSEKSRSRRFGRDNHLAGLRYRFDNHAGWTAESSLFWHRFHARVNDPDGTDENDYDTDTVGFRGSTRVLLFKRSVNILGGELELADTSGSVFQLGEVEGNKRSYRTLNGALYMSTQIDLGAGFEASLGIRYDGFSYSTHQNYHALSPKVRLAYRPDDKTVIWALVNRGFRVPSVGELYLKYASTFGLMFQGNNLLKAESLWAYEIGGRRLFFSDRLSLEAVTFWNEGNDTIEFVYSTPVSAMNLGRTRIIGAEGSVAGILTKWLTVRGSLTWMNSKNQDDGSLLLYRPDWKGAATVVLHERNWEWSTTAQYTGERFYDDFLDPSPPVPDPGTGLLRFPRRSLAPYWMLQSNVIWKRFQPLTISLHVRNLLNVSAHVIQDYPFPGMEWFLEARMEFE